MKCLFSLLLLVAAIMLFSGCADSSNDNSNSENLPAKPEVNQIDQPVENDEVPSALKEADLSLDKSAEKYFQQAKTDVDIFIQETPNVVVAKSPNDLETCSTNKEPKVVILKEPLKISVADGTNTAIASEENQTLFVDLFPCS